MFAPVFFPLRTFFSQARWGDKSVVTVFADPDRAHTEAAKVFKSRMQGTLTKQQIEDGPVPVPFMSIWRTEPQYDAQRDSRGWTGKFSVDKVSGTALRMRFPRPMTSDIHVDLWCGEGGHGIAESVQFQLELLFPNESVYLPIDWTLERWYRPPFDVVKHARHYGKTRGHLVTSGWIDNTSIERAQGSKEVRRTWSGRYEFYMPYRPEESRIVRDITIDIVEESSQAVLTTLNVGLED